MKCVADILRTVDVGPRIINLFESIRPLQVPELVEEGIVLFLLKCLHDRIQILLTYVPHSLLIVISHFNVNDLFPCLYGASELRIDAFSDQDDFNHCKVRQMSPTDASERVKRISDEVRDVAEREHIVLRLSYQVRSGSLC